VGCSERGGEKKGEGEEEKKKGKMQMAQLQGSTDGDILLKMESGVMPIGEDRSPFMIPVPSNRKPPCFPHMTHGWFCLQYCTDCFASFLCVLSIGCSWSFFILLFCFFMQNCCVLCCK
jgi:hypothetical protein